MSTAPLRWLGGLLVVYLAAPVLLFLIRFVHGPQRGFHVAGLFPSLLISISCATVSLVLVSLLGVPLAYVIGRSTSTTARLVEVAVSLPLALPPVMSGIIVVYLVGPYSVVGRLFGRHLTNSVYGIVIAMTFCSAPFLILAARAAFASLDQGLLDVAATLGHSEVSRFLRVAVPAAGPEIRAGMTMTWLRAFGEYGAVTILAFNPASLPIYTVNEFMARGLAPTMAPTVLALVVAAVVVVVSRVRFPGRTHVDLTRISPVPPALAPSARLRFDLATRRGAFELRVVHSARSDNLAVLGPSGSGKSVLLRSLAGIYGRGVGAVAFGDDEVGAAGPQRRRVGYVAQNFTLFAHLTVWGNVMFATNANPGNARYWLEHLHLDGLENRLPSQLSGGQTQRVALAQALCHSPEVLLLDEPFSSLDKPIRRELQRELRRLQRETGLATVIVTHDPEEAAVLAHEVIVLDHGRALQAGATRDLFSRPCSPRVARLLGLSNVHAARTTDSGIATPAGTSLPLDIPDLAPGTAVLWKVRPERLRVESAPGTTPHDASVLEFAGRVVDLADVGSSVDLFVQVEEDLELHARVTDPVDLEVGDPCTVLVSRGDIETWITAEPVDEPTDAETSASS